MRAGALAAFVFSAYDPPGNLEVIADRVLEFGQATAERDPQRLARAVVVSLGIKL